MKLIGIDLGGRKIAMSLWADDELYQVIAFSAAPNEVRHKQLRDVAFYVERVLRAAQPDYIFIENPIMGRSIASSMQLVETKGAVLAHNSQLLITLGTKVELANVMSWKKQVCGSGHASKEVVRMTISGLNGAYAALCGSDQDKYDAVAVGLYGLAVVRQAASIGAALADS